MKYINYESGFCITNYNIIDEELIKNQFDKLEELEKKLKYDIKCEREWTYLCGSSTIIDTLLLSKVNGTLPQILLGISIPLMLFCFTERIIRFNNAKNKLQELKKYKYFIENEDILNYEIIKNYLLSNEKDNISYNTQLIAIILNYLKIKNHLSSSKISNINDVIPLLTINDIENMDIKELEEIVELTKENNDPDEMKLNLSMFNKLKGTN